MPISTSNFILFFLDTTQIRRKRLFGNKNADHVNIDQTCPNKYLVLHEPAEDLVSDIAAMTISMKVFRLCSTMHFTSSTILESVFLVTLYTLYLATTAQKSPSKKRKMGRAFIISYSLQEQWFDFISGTKIWGIAKRRWQLGTTYLSKTGLEVILLHFREKKFWMTGSKLKKKNSLVALFLAQQW